MGYISSNVVGPQTIRAAADRVTLGTALVTFMAPPQIVSLTSQTTVPAGQALTLGVTVEGTPPFVFVFWKNSVRIPGAYFPTNGNSGSYTTPPLTLTDNG